MGDGEDMAGAVKNLKPTPYICDKNQEIKVKKVRIIQWNISLKSDIAKISDHLNELIASGPTIACLQEVRSSSYSILLDTLKPRSSSYSLDYRSPGSNEGLNRKMGIAILSFGCSITESGLIDRSVFPERTLRSNIAISEGEIRVLSFHSLTGVGYKKAKASNFAAIADYLEANKEIDFACFDANEPKVDSLNTRELEFWGKNGDHGEAASLILGANRVHNLEDSYRLFASANEVEDRELPISHLTRGVPRRYDYILSSSRWQVVSVDYPYDSSIAATSDHSLVVSDFIANKKE